MKSKASVRNAVVLIGDSIVGDIPQTMGSSAIAATESYIAVGCVEGADGETEFTLGPWEVVSPGTQPAFQGAVETRNRKIAVTVITGEVILESQVPYQNTMVGIWTNHPTEPDSVIVGFDKC